MTQTAASEDATAGAVFVMQSFGDFQSFHPHLHILATDGSFYTDGAFMVCPPPKTDGFEELFRHEVFKTEGKINAAVIQNMMRWIGSYN